MKTAALNLQRVYTTLVLAPILYAIIRYLPPLAFLGLVLFAGAIALYEFYRLSFGNRENYVFIAIGLFTSTLWLASYFLLEGPKAEHLFYGLCATLLIPLFVRRNLQHYLTDSATTLFGVLYIGLCLSYLLVLRTFPNGELLVILVLLVTWAADTGAYYTGTAFGRHPLAPMISPKKTVEGLVGGLGLAIGATFLMRYWFFSSITVWDCVTIGFLLTLAGLLGDLAESAIKRSVGAKDSGVLLPGHGGMLDRLDSLLFTGPALYYYVAFTGSEYFLLR